MTYDAADIETGVFNDYMKAKDENDWPVMHGTLISLLWVLLNDDMTAARIARATALAIFEGRKASAVDA